MSKFSRMIARCHRELLGSSKWYHKILDDFWFWLDHSIIDSTYYNIKNLIINTPMFLGLAWTWRPWDYCYTINVLVKLLTKQASCLKVGVNVKREKVYRRCMTAAGKLDRAYNRDVDKVLVYLMNKNPKSFKRIRNGKFYTLETKLVTDKRIYDGMYKVASKRSDKEEAKAKQEAWEYLHKYIEHFWD